MSVVKEAFNAINMNRVPERIALYNELCQAAEPMFELKGQSLEKVEMEHAKNLMFYDIMVQECRTIEDAIKLKIETIEADLYKNFTENHQRVLGAKDIQQYIKGDPKYVAAYEILLEVIHAKRQLEAITEALRTLGWALNNIVKLRVAQLEKTVL